MYTFFKNYKPQTKVSGRYINQAQCAIGNTAYAVQHKNRLPFFMLNNILGGPGLNSRLNLALREKKGYVYTIEAAYTPYMETGMFAVFFATEHPQLKKSIHIIQKELHKLKEIKLGTLQLHRAKEQLMGQLAMADENNLGLMLMMGKSILDLNRIESLTDIFDQIQKISANELQDISCEMFDLNSFSYLTYIPKKL